ncbi:GNAT family N-acetyltransferase [Streptomyces sp. NPDC088116]|uniref:GNAT family N-acetyltransferase n=1 Tax=Streptomyces sp. NPDC088116 TaxID=3365825 RepID=UPI003813047A
MRAEYEVRAPRESDLSAVTGMVSAAERSHDPEAGARTEDEFRREWARMDLARDAWVVTGPQGGVHGYAQVIAAPHEGRVFADAYTHPEHVGAGIGTTLLDRMEARATVMAAGIPSDAGLARVVLVNYVLLGGVADRMLRARGYGLTRVHKRMRIALDGPPAAPVWPSGVDVRTCDGTREDLRRVHACVEEAFADRWGRASRSYDQWAGDMMYEGFDPTLWLVAERAGRIVGASLCRARQVKGLASGEIGQLGVRREARRLGLGRALLLASFALFAERGAASVGLDVDSESPTGANHLYEQAGMATTVAIAQLERELRAGVDPLDPLDRVMAAPQAHGG